MHVHGELSGTLTAPKSIIGALSAPKGIQGILTVPTSAGIESYTGAYEFVPTAEVQTISIDHKLALSDIVIDPIPSNYGLITYNGSIITVS